MIIAASASSARAQVRIFRTNIASDPLWKMMKQLVQAGRIDCGHASIIMR